MKKNRFKDVDVKNVEALRNAVYELKNVSKRKLNDAICDIIDLGGYSIAVMVDTMPELEAGLQLEIAKKLEDFFYFHPENGRKLFGRIKKTLPLVDESVRKHFIASLSDISAEMEDGEKELGMLGDEALAILQSEADLMRMSKAIEIAVKGSRKDSMPHIINLMKKSIKNLDEYQGYQFIETALLAMKSLGGESILRLMINPASANALKQLRMEWREADESLTNNVLNALEAVDEDFAQVMLKVIELSEFSLPFAAMINEGLSHPDKWVRQAAAGTMQKASEGLEPEALSRLLNDEAPEVRLMAVTSLGGFTAAQTGGLLESIAMKSDETMDIRLNALYALYSQRNLAALISIVKASDNLKIKTNANSMAAMLMPHSEGIEHILELYGKASEELLPDVMPYLTELVEPEDIHTLIEVHGKSTGQVRERMLNLIHIVLEQKAGHRLDSAIDKLPMAEQEAIKMLKPAPKKHDKETETHHHEEECGCGHHHHHHHRY